jgi:DivIVA domain-containing protein
MEPQEVAGKEFLISMRGYVREDVRAFLRAVAEELFRQDELISGLRHKLEDANRRLDEANWQLEEANGEAAVDRATLVKLVGEEASAILGSADGAAERIRFEAERYAASVRDGVGSTADHLAELHANLGHLLAELRAMEPQGGRSADPAQADVVLLGPGDEAPYRAEIRLDESATSLE